MSTNYSSTTPAAPANGVNGTWQTDGSGNMSVYVPVSAAEIVSADVDLTAQVADITTTTLYTPSASGMYRVSAYLVVTTVSSPGSTLPALTIGWMDADNSTAQTLALTPTNAGNALTTYQDGTAVINALTAVAITYATSGYASGGVPMDFSLHIRIEAL